MKVAVIGAGASGLICAITIADEAKKNNIPVEVTVFESKDKPGKKLLATGNGRCNLMNANENDCFFSKNEFHRYAIKKYDVKNNLSFFSSLGLYTRHDEEGRLYPLSNQATSVLDALRFACTGSEVKIITDTEITTIKKHRKGFLLNNSLAFDKIVLACGSKAGVKNFNGYELLKQVGHEVTRLQPSLTKFEIEDKKTAKQLKGIRQKGVFTLNCNNKFVASEKGEMQFTDYGLSGIAIMQLSAYAARCHGKLSVKADFVSELSFDELYNAIRSYARSNRTLKNENLLSGLVSKRLGETVMKSLGINLSSPASELNDDEIRAVTHKLKKYVFSITSIKGFDESQVTAGGADALYFNEKTMESKKVKGLYCIGELMDVDGLCGGYNLHWAWSSGRLCGESIIINEQLNRKG